MADVLKAIEIVTGSTGDVHVTPIDDAVRNGNVGYAHDKVVFTYYENLRAQAITANEVRVFSGYGMNQGRIFKIDRNRYQSVTIENGSTGFKRADLIVARYSMDSQTGFEDINLVAIRGQSGTSYVDPSYTTGDINNGDMLDDFPLYRVKLNGITIEAVEPLFTPLPDGGRVGQFEKKIDTDMKVNLASESSGNLKNCENVNSLDIGVKGTLSINHGGTGQTTAQASFNALAGGAGTNTDVPLDSDVVITKTGNTWYQKTFSKIWAYIQAKISSALGLTSSQYNGNSATATTLSQALAVNKGGTGKTSIGNNKVLVGNSSGGFSELGIDTAPSSASNNLITSKGVADALGSAGYGDMLKSTYDPNNDGIIGIAQGGTGSNDGTLNGVKLAKSGNSYGYMDGSTFKSFRQPTGGVATANQATAAQVLSGKHFANSSGDDITGTFASQEKTITASRSAQTVTPDSGKWLSKVTVNKYPDANGTFTTSANNSAVDMGASNNYRYVNTTGVYNAGYNAGTSASQGVTWTEKMQVRTDGDSVARVEISLINVVSIKFDGYSYHTDGHIYFYTKASLSTHGQTPDSIRTWSNPSAGTVMNGFNSNEKYMYIYGDFTQMAVLTITRQAKKLR